MRSFIGIPLSLTLALAAAPAVMAAPSGDNFLAGKNILFVGDANGSQKSTDDKIASHLTSLGARVSFVDDSQEPMAFNGQDLVIISSTADDQLMDGRFRDAPVPVLTWNSGYLPRLGMTGTVEGRDFGTTEAPDTYLSMTNAPHPMSAGLNAGNFVATNKGRKMTWGHPGPSAAVIATPPGYPEKATIFGYEKGAMLATESTAPARRVAFFFQDSSFDVIEAVAGGRDAQGLPLFDAAVRWAVAPPSQNGVVKGDMGKANGKKLLFVTLPKSPHPDPEVRAAVDRTNVFLMKHFKSLGFNATMVGENDPIAHAKGQDLIVIGATVRANKVLGRYKDVSVPILCLENDILDDMAMTGKRRSIDFGEVEHTTPILLNPTHPVAAGVASGPVHLYNSEGALGFGIPGPGATVIAAADHGEKGLIFGYEQGATMSNDVAAPARRIYFPIDFKGVDDLTDSGLKIFNSALFWAANGR